MLKKIGSFLVGSLALLILGLISILLVVRMFFGPTTMTNVFGRFIAEEIGEDERLKEFFDEDELSKVMGEFMSDYFKYIGGVPGADRPSVDEIVDVMGEMANEYAKENNLEEISDADLQELRDDLELSFDDLFNEEEDEDIKLVFSLVYSQALLIGLIIAFVGLLLLNYLIRKDWFIIMRHTGIISSVNSIVFIACSLLLSSVGSSMEDPTEGALVKGFVDCFLTVGIICLALGVLLIVLSIVFKKKKNNNMIPDNNNNVMMNNTNYNNMNNNYNM